MFLMKNILIIFLFLKILIQYSLVINGNKFKPVNSLIEKLILQNSWVGFKIKF